MPYIGTDINYGNLAKQTGTGDGADTTPIAALTYTVPSSESILVFLDGVCQVPSTDFTATGTTLTFTTAPANGVAILVMFLGRSLDIGTPADNTVGLAQLAGGTDGNLITYDASGDPANVATGTATHVLTSNGAGAAPTFQAASGGDLRNFIIDGNMTQFPEGGKTGVANGKYTSALWSYHETGDLVIDSAQETSDLPASTYTGLKIDCTTADSGGDAGDLMLLRYDITGSDYALLHNGKAVTFSFALRSTSGGEFCVSFSNSAQNRVYKVALTAAVNTWETHTVTFTTDTSGTWLFTEADIGLQINLCFMAGSTWTGGTEEDWTNTTRFGSNSNAQHLTSTSNFIRLTNVGLYLGSSAPSAFLGESISTVRDQVERYVEEWSFDSVSNEAFPMPLYFRTTAAIEIPFQYRTRKRATPSLTLTVNSTFNVVYGGGSVVDGDGNPPATQDIGKSGCIITMVAASAVFTAGETGRIRRDSTDTANILIDARH